MRDIRNDLRERLAAVCEQIADVRGEYDHDRNDLERRFNERLMALSAEMSSLKTILESEARRQGDEPVSFPKAKAPILRAPLADFLVYILKEREPLSKDDLRAMAENHQYFPDGTSSGRPVHATLMNLVRSGRVQETSDGLYTCGYANGIELPIFDKVLKNNEGPNAFAFEPS
jgi:hypothetical protein